MTIKIVGSAPKLKYLPVASLDVDRVWYQRNLAPEKTRKRWLKNGFDWSKVKVLSVGKRPDDTHFVYDGANTLAMAIASGISKLPCSIVFTNGPEEEAKLFEDMNSNRTNPTAMDKYKAALTHKMSADALVVKDLLSKYSLNLHENKMDKTTLSCVGILRNNVKRYSGRGEILDLTIKHLMNAFDDENRFQADLIHGACSFNNQIIKEGLCVDDCWKKIANSKVTCSDILVSAFNRQKASLKAGASRKTEVTNALFELIR